MITETMGSGVCVLLGIAVFGGIMNAFLFKRLSIPQVLGYMVTGVVIGESGFHLVRATDIEQFAPINLFCLSVIGFLVGSELRFDVMKKYGRQFSTILIAEGLGAFILVSVSVFMVVFMITQDIAIACAAGVVFGAIASATDPASTIAVLWEYRTAGVLTVTLTAIVALDDALAMTLYGTGSSLAQILSGSNVNVFWEFAHIAFELLGSVALGIAAGYIISFILNRSNTLDSITASTIGILLLLTGLTDIYKMDIILTAMAAGLTITNVSPHLSQKLISRIKAFSVPIYVLFFVFVGARLTLNAMPMWLWGIVGIYVTGRSIGKIGGAWIGGKLSGAPLSVVKYCGMGLFAQGGVAVGLSIMAGHHLQSVMIADSLSLGDTIIFGITTTTFIIQLLGPALVKLAVKRAGEIGRNVTVDDILDTVAVKTIAKKDFPRLTASTPLRKVFDHFVNTPFATLPVISSSKHLIGIIGIEELRQTITDQEAWDWIITNDILSIPKTKISETDTLAKAVKNFEMLDISEQIVLDSENKVTGIIRHADIREFVKKQMVSLQSQSMYPVQNASVAAT